MKKPLSSNKCRLNGVLWIAADLHLGPQAPGSNRAFLHFMRQATTQADALLLCGDIFDAWIGDDQCLKPEPWLQDVCTALKNYSHRRPLYVMRGNRDFLLGQGFALHVGATLLPERIILETEAGRILLSHGDEYCTDDVAYQRFRRIVRWPWLQALYLTMPLSWRHAIASYFRRKSRQDNQHKASYLMDVNESAVQAALKSTPAHSLIHGHTHRPGRHRLGDTARGFRWVLPDWDYDDAERGGYIQIEPGKICLVQHAHPDECQWVPAEGN